MKTINVKIEVPEDKYCRTFDHAEHCHSDSDGDCTWEHCPQIRDGEPQKTGRTCPLYRQDKKIDGYFGE